MPHDSGLRHTRSHTCASVRPSTARAEQHTARHLCFRHERRALHTVLHVSRAGCSSTLSRGGLSLRRRSKSTSMRWYSSQGTETLVAWQRHVTLTLSLHSPQGESERVKEDERKEERRERKWRIVRMTGTRRKRVHMINKTEIVKL